jgi:hypothetical protein
VSLNQVDEAVGDAACLGVKQDRLFSVHLADYQKLPPPMHLRSQKLCAIGNQSINDIKIARRFKLATYCGF